MNNKTLFIKKDVEKETYKRAGEEHAQDDDGPDHLKYTRRFHNFKLTVF